MADTYTIISQRQTTDLDPSHRFVDVMAVTFRSEPSGTVGEVRIPLDRYTPATVAEAIEAYRDRIEGVAGL